jgi:hypothetical protein
MSQLPPCALAGGSRAAGPQLAHRTRRHTHRPVGPSQARRAPVQALHPFASTPAPYAAHRAPWLVLVHCWIPGGGHDGEVTISRQYHGLLRGCTYHSSHPTSWGLVSIYDRIAVQACRERRGGLWASHPRLNSPGPPTATPLWHAALVGVVRQRDGVCPGDTHSRHSLKCACLPAPRLRPALREGRGFPTRPLTGSDSPPSDKQ